MKRLSLEEIKKIQIDILDSVSEYCESKGISYFLTYGTLIGSIRHKGYIPWDDDIDLAMPRPDFERFIREFNSLSSDYKVFSTAQDKDYPYPFAKVAYERSVIIEEENESFKNVGINIDIFPIDGLPQSQEEQDKLFKRIQSVKRILNMRNLPPKEGRAFYKNLALKSLKIINYRPLVKKISDIAQENIYGESDYVGMIAWSGASKIPTVSKDLFENYIMGDFEGKKYRIPVGYHDFLTTTYGDYMQLPPEEERVPHHHVKAFLKE